MMGLRSKDYNKHTRRRTALVDQLGILRRNKELIMATAEPARKECSVGEEQAMLYLNKTELSFIINIIVPTTIVLVMKANLQLLFAGATQKQTSTQNYLNYQQQSFASTYIQTFTLNCFILQVTVHTQGLLLLVLMCLFFPRHLQLAFVMVLYWLLMRLRWCLAAACSHLLYGPSAFTAKMLQSWVVWALQLSIVNFTYSKLVHFIWKWLNYLIFSKTEVLLL